MMNHLAEEADFLDATTRLKNYSLHTSLYKKPTIPKPIYTPLAPIPHTSLPP